MLIRSIILVLFLSWLVSAAVKHQGTNADKWQDTQVTTNVWRAISTGNLEDLQGMLETNPDVAHIRSGDGRGPLWWAYEYGQQDMIKVLLDAGTNPDEKDGDGRKPADVKEVGETEYIQKQREEAEYVFEDAAPVDSGIPDEDEDE